MISRNKKATVTSLVFNDLYFYVNAYLDHKNKVVSNLMSNKVD